MSSTVHNVDRAEFVLFGTKGLIDVSSEEASAVIKGSVIHSQEDKYAVISAPLSEYGKLLNLRTVDDIRWLAGQKQVRTESEFVEFLESARLRAQSILAQDGRSDETWSVTMSTRRPVWRDQPRWSPRDHLGAIWSGADPDAKKRSGIDMRLQVDGCTMLACLSLAETGVWNRNKSAPIWRGGLRASIAALLVNVFERQAGEVIRTRGIYDPFCGSGTILAEALAVGISVDGSDIESEAIEIARNRLAATPKGAAVRDPALFVHDAHNGFPASRVKSASIITNMPWGKQVKIPRKTELFDATALLIAESLARGGIAVILTGDPEQLSARIRRNVQAARIETLQIGMLGQTPTVLTVVNE